jgi:hypothetical protein
MYQMPDDFFGKARHFLLVNRNNEVRWFDNDFAPWLTDNQKN